MLTRCVGRRGLSEDGVRTLASLELQSREAVAACTAARLAGWALSVGAPVSAELAVRAASQANRQCRYALALDFVQAVPLADRPLLWQGRTTALPPGDYQVRLAVSGAEIATDDVTADDYADLADLMILAAGGIVSSEAGTAIDRALALDPANGAARYYDGLLHLQVHRYDLAFSTWDRLLTDSAPDDPWVAPVLAQMPQVAQLAGVRWTPPSAPPIVGPDSPGPSQGDIDAAADRVTAGGGTILNGPMEVPGGAWIIQASDPQGAMFALVGSKDAA